MILAAAPLPFWDDLWVVLLVAAVGVPMGIAARVYVRRRYPAAARAHRDKTRETRWPNWVLGSAFWFLFAVMMWHWGSPSFTILYACFGVACLFGMVSSVRRHRSQWSIATMLLIMLIVALGCSLLTWVGWPMVYVLIAMLWVIVSWPALVRLYVWWRTRGPTCECEDNHDETPD